MQKQKRRAVLRALKDGGAEGIVVEESVYFRELGEELQAELTGDQIGRVMLRMMSMHQRGVEFAQVGTDRHYTHQVVGGHIVVRSKDAAVIPREMKQMVVRSVERVEREMCPTLVQDKIQLWFAPGRALLFDISQAGPCYPQALGRYLVKVARTVEGDGPEPEESLKNS